jgi:hypothetical protein
VNLYKQYLRPNLEFAEQAWNLWAQQDKDKLEKVQKKPVGIVSGLEGKTYVERLAELDLKIVEERRYQADILQVYKILTGK